MLIIIVILIFILGFILSIPDIKLRNQVINRLTVAFVLQVLIFIIYRFELLSLGRDVYYSDAEVYWNHTLQYLSGNIYYAYNDVYIWISYYIQKTSPFIWVGWNNIFNILMVDLSILMCAYIIYKENNQSLKMHRNLNVIQFLNWTLFNPLIIYSLMRNLKDGVYLFMVCFVIFVYYKCKEKSSRLNSFFFLIFIIIMAIILYGIRPWAFVTSLIALFIFILDMNITKRNKILYFLFISLVIIGIINVSSNFQRIVSSTQLWIPIILESYSEQSALESILSIPRLFIGPGPFRSLLGSWYVYTKLNNYVKNNNLIEPSKVRFNSTEKLMDAQLCGCESLFVGVG